MKTFVINLKRRPDRLQNFMNNVGNYLTDFDLEVVEAVDGETYDHEPEKNLINPWNFKNLSEKKMKAIVACCKSHLMAYEKLINSDFPHALVFEDDAYPVVDPKNLANEIKSIDLPKNFGFIYLNRLQKPLNNPEIPSLTPATRGQTAESYIISRNFAKIAYESISKSMGAFDRQLEIYVQTKQNTPDYEFYVANRQLFYQNNRQDTDIQKR